MITVFIPYSGRANCWKKLSRFLDQQTYPHDQLQILILDTTGRFSEEVSDWAEKCGYLCLIIKHPMPDSSKVNDYRWKVEETDALNYAMCNIYNAMLRSLMSQYVWIIEDDVIPPLDALHQLLKDMTPGTISVAGVYKNHLNGFYNVWRNSHDPQPLVKQRGDGVEIVEGNGFGCVLLDSKQFSRFTYTPELKSSRVFWGYDMEFYHDKMTAKVNWNVDCEHLAEQPPKPLLRWVIGNVKGVGMDVFQESVAQAKKTFGTRFDYLVCWNSDEPPVNLGVATLKQRWDNCPIPVELDKCEGSLWKYCPCRMRLAGYEIIVDNDVVIFDPNIFNEFLNSGRPMIASCAHRFYGQYNKLIPKTDTCYNTGIVGFPPYFDPCDMMRELYEPSKMFTYGDEQGLMAYILSLNDPVVLSFPHVYANMFPIIHPEAQVCVGWTDGTLNTDKAIHFVQANRKISHKGWLRYNNRALKEFI